MPNSKKDTTQMTIFAPEPIISDLTNQSKHIVAPLIKFQKIELL